MILAGWIVLLLSIAVVALCFSLVLLQHEWGKKKKRQKTSNPGRCVGTLGTFPNTMPPRTNSSSRSPASVLLVDEAAAHRAKGNPEHDNGNDVLAIPPFVPGILIGPDDSFKTNEDSECPTSGVAGVIL